MTILLQKTGFQFFTLAKIEIMKIYKTAGLAILMLLISTSCGEEFLDRKKLGELSSDSFFTQPDHAVWATNATYNQLRDWLVHVFSYIGVTDIISDDADKGSIPNDANFLQEIDDFTYDPGNTALGGVWTGYFRGIYRANYAIEGIPTVPNLDPALADRLIAENRFLRAYFYFSLVRWFGDLPLITMPLAPDEFVQTRVPKEQIYDLIISDLEFAIASLPTRSEYPSADLGRATQGAAQGLLAKVYLTVGDFQQAETLAMEVINSNEYSLFSDYATLFREENENNVESLFEVQATAFPEGGGGSQYNQVQGVRGTPNLGWGFNRPSDDLVRAYEPGDPRREATILNVGEVLPDGSAIVEDNPGVDNERYNQKSWVARHPGGLGNGPGNIRVLRYADVLLMAAEAMNENGNSTDALALLNQVRERARGGNPNLLPDVTTTNQDQLRTRIWQERRVELAMEQHRWFDLIRQGRAAEVMTGVGKLNFVEGKHELLPIPQTEIDVTAGALTQNPNW